MPENAVPEPAVTRSAKGYLIDKVKKMLIIQKIKNFIKEIRSLRDSSREIKSLSEASTLLSESQKELNRAHRYFDAGLIKETGKILDRVQELQSEIDELLED